MATYRIRSCKLTVTSNTLSAEDLHFISVPVITLWSTFALSCLVWNPRWCKYTGLNSVDCGIVISWRAVGLCASFVLALSLLQQCTVAIMHHMHNCSIAKLVSSWIYWCCLFFMCQRVRESVLLSHHQPLLLGLVVGVSWNCCSWPVTDNVIVALADFSVAPCILATVLLQ